MDTSEEEYVSTIDGTIVTHLIGIEDYSVECAYVVFDKNEWDTLNKDIFNKWNWEQRLGFVRWCQYVGSITPNEYDIIQDREQ